MRRPPSLALRLTLLFSGAAAIIFAVFGWVINHSTEKHFEEGDTAELLVIARTVEKALINVHSTDELTTIEHRFEDILVGHHRASLYLIDKDNQVIYASPGPDPSAIVSLTSQKNSNGNAVRPWSNEDHSYRVLIQRMGEQTTAASRRPYTTAIAVQTDYHLQFLEHFHRTLWLMIVSSIAIISAMSWIAVRQGHAPLRDIITKIRRISANELNTRLSPEAMPRELKDLAASFNEMLHGVDKAFHRLAEFNADIAHELRTPITNLMTQTQVALSRARTIDEYREILYSNMEEYERMAQIVGDMLFLAQTDSSPFVRTITNLDLTKELRALFEYYEGWAEECGVSLSLEGTAGIQGDHLMLQRALGNLLSNAIRHTSAGGTVRVELGTSHDGKVSIVVENPGTEIPPEHLPKLFDRFYSVDPSKQRSGGGAGLGLAIVKSIIDAHGGSIDVVSTAGRTRFRIILPKSRI